MSELPQTYSEAVHDEGWSTAIQDELLSLKESESWKLVQLSEVPDGSEITDSKWVFREKLMNEKVVKKVRLVARGFKQFSLDDNIHPLQK